MLGIDIVDHSDPLLKKREGRALSLVLNERDEWPDAKLTSQEHFWILWVAKEAVFKARRTHTRFMPTEITVKITGLEKGKYHFVSDKMKGFIEQNAFFTLAVCATVPIHQVFYHISQTAGKDLSVEVRELAKVELKQNWKVNPVFFTNASGIPEVKVKDKQRDKEWIGPISFTHHYRWIGFVCVHPSFYRA